MSHNFVVVDPYPRTWVEIDLPALAHNLAVIRHHLPGPDVLVALVAKADAYGHGVVAVSRYALKHGADWIAVATVQEGIELREAGIQSPILVLSAVLEEEAGQAVFYDLRLMVERLELAEVVSSATIDMERVARVHIPVDTGMSRFGLTPDEAPDFINQVQSLPGLVVEGIATHFADSTEHPELTRQQFDRFQRMLEKCPPVALVHAANSGAVIHSSQTAMDLVRVGIAAYGIDAHHAFNGELRPVMSWKSRVISLRWRPAGTVVGYGGTHVCQRDTLIATIGVGYGDGYPRSLSHVGFVDLNGQRAGVLGLICMDQMMVDATDIPGVAVGNEVQLIGGVMDAATLGQLAQTNEYEIPTRIAPRVPRRYRYEETVGPSLHSE